MVAVRVSADERMAVVGSPAYFTSQDRPKSPDELHALPLHSLSLHWQRRVVRWEFERNGRELEVEPEGSLIINDNDLMIDAANAASASPSSSAPAPPISPPAHSKK